MPGPEKEMIQGGERNIYQQSLQIRNCMEKMNTELLFTHCASTRALEHQVESGGSRFTTNKRFFLFA